MPEANAPSEGFGALRYAITHPTNTYIFSEIKSDSYMGSIVFSALVRLLRETKHPTRNIQFFKYPINL